MPREGRSVSGPTIKALNAIPGCVAYKIHVSAYQMAGLPDIFCCCRGQCYWFESKLPKGAKPRPIQVVRMAELRKAGAIVAVIHSKEEALECLNADISKMCSLTMASGVIEYLRLAIRRKG